MAVKQENGAAIRPRSERLYGVHYGQFGAGPDLKTRLIK